MPSLAGFAGALSHGFPRAKQGAPACSPSPALRERVGVREPYANEVAAREVTSLSTTTNTGRTATCTQNTHGLRCRRMARSICSSKAVMVASVRS